MAGPGLLGFDAQTWARLSPLLDEALELPEAERAAWLAALPGSAADLHELLRRLLAGAPGPLCAASALADEAALDGPQRERGDRVGPYRLLEALGSGGMGEVWLAERADGQLQRQVALKLPHAEMLSPGLAARLARERDILAALVHPNIARLYDAGVSPEGQPYLAIEAVQGQAIDTWCAARALDVVARLRLFLQVARAVAYAHSQLVVHRDLKPSNLLVDDAGSVKLLDFGIAKLVSEPGPSELTARGGPVMTPGYASPEQVSGQPVGTGSDVYSLGVVLYELLAGTGPYRPLRDSRAALEEAVLSAEPRRPSEAAADVARRKALRGDLDTIVLHALQKSPGDRYPTVDALADDIERHLEDRPLRARPDGRWRAFAKLVRRNRFAVGAAAALLLTVLGGAGAALWQARIAVVERQRAEDVKDFVAEIFREANPYEGSGKQALTAVDLLKQADKKLETTLAGQTGARVELSNMIGQSLLALGDVPAAEPVVTRAVAEASRSLGPTHAQTLRALMLQSQVHRLRGRPQQARADLDSALPAMRARAGSAAGATDLATALMDRALTAVDLGAYADAEQFARESAELAAARLGERDPQRIASAVTLALVYLHANKFDLARDSSEQAFRVAIAVHGETPPHPRVIEARSIYARALAVTGDLVRGVAMLEAALADNRALLGPKNLHAGMLVQNLVGYRLDLGELELADANAAEALAILAEHFAPDSMNYAMLLHTRATTLLARRKAAVARAQATQALAAFDRLLGASHEVTVGARTTVALALLLEGRPDAAAREIDAVAPHIAALAPASALRARVALARGTIAHVRGDHAAALQHLQALVDSDQPAPKWQRERMRARAQIGLVQLDQGAPTQAILSLERALQDFERLETRVTPARADALVGLGRAHLALGNPVRALPLLEQATLFWRGFDAPGRSATAAAELLARAHAALGRPQIP